MKTFVAFLMLSSFSFADCPSVDPTFPGELPKELTVAQVNAPEGMLAAKIIQQNECYTSCSYEWQSMLCDSNGENCDLNDVTLSISNRKAWSLNSSGVIKFYATRTCLIISELEQPPEISKGILSVLIP